MTSDLFGRFYFKQTSNGNLTGEFSNSTSNQISTESCDYLPQKNPDIGKRANDYIGNYDSTWQENGAPHFAKLEITKNKINDRLFILKWMDKGGALIFKGEGMLCDDILIGDYQGVGKGPAPGQP